MSLFKQFTHVSVTVTDVAKAREFYSDTKAGARVMQAAATHR
jgi:catechol 2,3-dioxygenase-like lactoylglutathione lyase family enzyme